MKISKLFREAYGRGKPVNVSFVVKSFDYARSFLDNFMHEDEGFQELIAKSGYSLPNSDNLDGMTDLPSSLKPEMANILKIMDEYKQLSDSAKKLKEKFKVATKQLDKISSVVRDEEERSFDAQDAAWAAKNKKPQ